MKTKISITDYLKLGGKPENIDFTNSFLDYYSNFNYKQEVVSYEDRGETNTQGDPLWYFKFKNGNIERYALNWILIEVEFILDPKFTK